MGLGSWAGTFTGVSSHFALPTPSGETGRPEGLPWAGHPSQVALRQVLAKSFPLDSRLCYGEGSGCVSPCLLPPPCARAKRCFLVLQISGGSLQTLFTDGSRKSHWCSVCPGLSVCKDAGDNFQALHMLEWKPSPSPASIFLMTLVITWNYILYLIVHSLFCLSSSLEHKTQKTGTSSVCSPSSPHLEEWLFPIALMVALGAGSLGHKIGPAHTEAGGFSPVTSKWPAVLPSCGG